MTITHNLGFPTIGHRRELKTTIEAYWNGQLKESDLENIARQLRARHWYLQKESGMDAIPVGDFSYYDRMLDMVVSLGAIPKRFQLSKINNLQDYFLLARGDESHPAMEMTKWFDTNYHYIVPEFTQETQFSAYPDTILEAIAEAKNLQIQTKPVLIGPITFLFLGKEKDTAHPDFDRLSLLPELLVAYQQILSEIKQQGIEWVQIDEPALAMDLPFPWLKELANAYQALASSAPKILLTTYFDSVEELAAELKKLPVAGLHLDLVRAEKQLDSFLSNYPEDKILSLGLIDGRNIWKADLEKCLKLAETAKAVVGDRLWLAPSCSLLHVPVDLAQETRLDESLKNWLAFGVQKLEEIQIIRLGLEHGSDYIATELAHNKQVQADRKQSPKIHNANVKERIQALKEQDSKRSQPFTSREKIQKENFNLPLFPTTTIGSFPQTETIRKQRADYKKGRISQSVYTEAMRHEIQQVIEKQEALELDVLVHGEPERNDMVEYFGEQLAGFAFTQHGWVQSYGTRCVKPPIIFGDVYRPSPMTVDWITYAQSLTQKPVKGMLTGPVTILQWSFYRNDQDRSETAFQIALAIRDEVCDLEKAGIQIIQIDEPAYREGLPLKRKDWSFYLGWASKAFRLSSSGVDSGTQIHTHMCYSEFNHILEAIASMDADVITIEASRSGLELLEGLSDFKYPNEIGPGVYDVHSPSIPVAQDITERLSVMAQAVPHTRLWVNPDCGLKTRNWKEVEPSLHHMVQAAKAMRAMHPTQALQTT